MKDQALEETVLILFQPVVHGCFQLIGITIKDTNMSLSQYCHTGQLSKVGQEGLVHTK